MSFIKAGHNPSMERKPTVVVVGTHLDKVDNSKAGKFNNVSPLLSMAFWFLSILFR